MNKRLQNLHRYAPAIVRIGMSLVFLWFGSNQLMHTAMWTGVVPAWAVSLFGNAGVVVHMNAWFEIVCALALITGIQVRAVSILLGVHLLTIASTFGFSATGIRDIGLSIATFSIFFAGPDAFTLDRRFWSKDVA